MLDCTLMVVEGYCRGTQRRFWFLEVCFWGCGDRTQRGGAVGVDGGVGSGSMAGSGSMRGGGVGAVAKVEAVGVGRGDGESVGCDGGVEVGGGTIKFFILSKLVKTHLVTMLIKIK